MPEEADVGAPVEAPTRHERGGLEFDRVAFFTDAIFAIAMTVIVVGIHIPELTDQELPDELRPALVDLLPEVGSFFLSFAVLGSFWLAHHRSFGRLAAVDSGFIILNLIYLAFIAFLPFPTDLLGSYGSEVLPTVVYAINVALISTLETACLDRASRQDLLVRPLGRVERRWALIGTASPVYVFALSIPVAFLFGATPAKLCWLGLLVLGPVLGRLQARSEARNDARNEARQPA
jgi:uncharacterized membrane protein